MSYLCHFVLVFSVLLALRLPRLGERANLSAFRTFFRFVLVWICRFPLPLSVWEGLRIVIMALPGLFSYLFWRDLRSTKFIQTMIPGWPLTFWWQGQICVLVALKILEKCCMASTDKQWLFYLGEQFVGLLWSFLWGIIHLPFIVHKESSNGLNIRWKTTRDNYIKLL